MQLKKVVVASLNPVKWNAAVAGLESMFPGCQFAVDAVTVPSGVAAQPMSDSETLEGALHRVSKAREAMPEADLWVGIEGGVASMGGELTAFAWVVVQSKELLGKARSGAFFLPQAVAELVQQGLELGTADDRVFQKTNSKQQGGAIGILTANALDRQQLYEQAVMLALVPFKNEQLYGANSTLT